MAGEVVKRGFFSVPRLENQGEGADGKGGGEGVECRRERGRGGWTPRCSASFGAGGGVGPCCTGLRLKNWPL